MSTLIIRSGGEPAEESVTSTFALMFAVVTLGLCLVAADVVSLPRVLTRFPWSVLIIYVFLELFTGMVARTRLMEAVAIRLSTLSRGRRLWVLVLFGALMFIVSSFLNNLTAALILLPIIFVLLQAMELDQRFVASFFSLLLAVCNTGGAATPIGDFPAILIMSSGLTSFPSYLALAFPLFLATTVVLIGMHVLCLRRMGVAQENADAAARQRGVHFLNVQYRYLQVDTSSARRLGFCFVLMFVAWSLLPARLVPPEVVAMAGFALAVLLLGKKGTAPALRAFDLKPVLTIGAFLYLSSIAADTGILNQIAAALQAQITDPLALMVAVMMLTALLSGLLSAGPAAAAMLPLVQQLAAPGGPLAASRDEMAVAFAASICAGSSLFIWSATAGLVLSGKVSDGGLQAPDGQRLGWSVRQYLPFGVLHFCVQMAIAIAWVLIFIDFDR